MKGKKKDFLLKIFWFLHNFQIYPIILLFTFVETEVLTVGPLIDIQNRKFKSPRLHYNSKTHNNLHMMYILVLVLCVNISLGVTAYSLTSSASRAFLIFNINV